LYVLRGRTPCRRYPHPGRRGILTANIPLPYGTEQTMAESELLLTAQRFQVVRLRRNLPDGSTDTRDVVRHPGAVVILPLLDDGRVCLVENFRVAVDDRLLELPAGTLEPGEDPADTARRELAEETGYRAAKIEHLHSFWMSPGILSERMHLYLAKGLQPGPMDLDAGEDLRPLLFTWNEALELVAQHRIEDAKSLCGLLYYEVFHRTRQ
jgi:ADP-ribose pyrophosphatase